VQKFNSPAAGANDFAFRLSKELLKSSGKGNFLCSPFSAWMPLAALTNAADAASRPALLDAIGAAGFPAGQLNEAAGQMLAALTKPALSDHNPLQIANAVFVGRDAALKKSFQTVFSENYGGKAFSVDFSSPLAVKAINDWASENTNGLIPSIIQQFDPATAAAIANAIYFADRWAWEFRPGETKAGAFHGLGGGSTAQFMRREGNRQIYYEDDRLQATPLEFKTGGGLYILLPKDDGAVSLLSGLTDDGFRRIREDSRWMSGTLLLPRFKIDNAGTELTGALQALGVPLFDERAAPLTGGLVEGNAPLWLSGAFQKAKIEVDEKGTTTAAVTVMAMCGSALFEPTAPFEMICDKPFAFVLYSNGGQILFTGVVNQVG